MAIAQFTVTLILLFYPGIVSMLIIEWFVVTKEKPTFYFLLHCLTLGFVNYTLYYSILKIASGAHAGAPVDLNFLEVLGNTNRGIDYNEVLWVTVVAICTSIIISFIINKKYVYRIAQWVGVTNKFQELDVWDYLHNSSSKRMQWVTVRDHKNFLAYEG